MGRSRDPVIGFRGQLDSRVYSGLQGITTQGFQEANSKNGTQYEFASFIAALGASAATDFLIRVGSQPVLLKDLTVQFDSEQISRQLFEAPTTSGLGTPLTVYNLNSRNPKSKGTEVYPDGEFTLSDDGTAHSPRLYALGSAGIGARTVAGLSRVAGRDRVLAENTDYLLRVTNEDDTNASRISAYATFYEGPISTEILA